MKRIIIHTILFFVFIPIFANAQQTSWEVVYVDVFSVEMPEGSIWIDTLNQLSISAEGEYGYFQAAKIPQPGVQILSEGGMSAFYREFIEAYSPGSTPRGSSSLMIENFIASRFGFEKTNPDGIQTVTVLAVLLKDTCYTFEYSTTDPTAAGARDEMDKFFFSVKVSPEKVNERQFTEEEFTSESEENRAPAAVVKDILKGIMIACLVAVVVLWLLKKRKILNDIRINAGYTFVSLGGLFVLSFVANLFLGVVDVYLLYIGLFCIAVGAVFFKVGNSKKEPPGRDDTNK